MAFRFFPPGTQQFTNDGQVLAGGSIAFTDSGTTNPRTTWSDPGMTTPNPNPVPLDASGRPNNDIWGDGSYRVTIRDVFGAVIPPPLDDVSGPLGIPDPALQSGRFLTNDGTVVFWQAILQVPDPTGQPDGNVLTTDGAGNIAWEASGIANVRQVSDPAGVTDGWVLTRDDASPGDYAWMALPEAAAQNWSDQTANRTLGNVYTNDQSAPIEVNVACRCRRASAGGGEFIAQVNAITVGLAHAPGSADVNSTISFRVPPAGTYSVSNSGANNGYIWAELRQP